MMEMWVYQGQRQMKADEKWLVLTLRQVMMRNKHLVKMDDLRNVDTIDLIAKVNKKKH